MGWLFIIQSAQCYFAVGALLKTDKLCEIELVQSTELGSAWKNLRGFKLFPLVLSCMQYAWPVQNSGLNFSLNFITRLRSWAPRFSFVCIGEGLVCLSKCVGCTRWDSAGWFCEHRSACSADRKYSGCCLPELYWENEGWGNVSQELT